MTSKESARTRRFRFKFSLLSMLILILLLGSGFGLMMRINEAARQRAIVDRLRAAGVTVEGQDKQGSLIEISKGHGLIDLFDTEILNRVTLIEYQHPDSGVVSLGEFRNLKVLSLPYGFDDYSVLKGLSRLESLRFATSSIDAAPMKDLTNLGSLHIWLCGSVYDGDAGDIMAAHALAESESLPLRHANLKVINIAPVASMTKLEVLHIRSYGVIDVSPIGACKNLKVLTLDAPIVNLSALKELHKLKEIQLNRIHDLNHENIRSLRLMLPNCKILTY